MLLLSFWDLINYRTNRTSQRTVPFQWSVREGNIKCFDYEACICELSLMNFRNSYDECLFYPNEIFNNKKLKIILCNIIHLFSRVWRYVMLNLILNPKSFRMMSLQSILITMLFMQYLILRIGLRRGLWLCILWLYYNHNKC